MADVWHYTNDGKPQTPVTKDELRNLAERGLLKSTDLVWTEGMSQWQRASNVAGIFAAPEKARSGIRSGTQNWADAPIPLAAEPTPVRSDPDRDDLDDRPRRRRRQDQWEEDDLEFDDARPRRRRRQSGGAKLAIILGSIAGVVLLVGVIIAVVVMASGHGGEGTRSFSLRTNEKSNFKVRFVQGKPVEIWVTSNENSDVDVFVWDERNVRVAFDDGPSKDCYVRFVPTATQTYRIEVWNRLLMGMGANLRNRSNSGTMRFRQADQPLGGPLPEQDFPNAAPVFAQPDFNPPFVQPPVVVPPIPRPPIVQPPIVRPPVVRPPLVTPNIPVVRPPVVRPPGGRIR